MIIVYSFGGSILTNLDSEKIKKYAEALKDLSKDHKIFVIVGGGRIAREYIQKARALGASEIFCDNIGIIATRMNAMIMAAALGNAAPEEIPQNYTDAAESHHRIVVMGGINPGQTTDAVSALLAERLHADRLVIVTSVDGIYTADPEIDSSAQKLKIVTIQELVQMAMKTDIKAGSRSPIDPIAAKIIERSSIPTVVVNGKDIENLKKGALGGHNGTEIKQE